MTDWLSYWNAQPLQADERDFLRQVGKTVNGVPVAWEEVDLIVEALRSGLQLNASDTVLDLCCGNGLITRRVAGACGTIIGVDTQNP